MPLFYSSCKVSTKAKLRIFQTIVISVLAYGAESWKTTKGLDDHLDAFQSKCLMQILGIVYIGLKGSEKEK